MDDIINECNNYGGVVHIFVDRESEQGNVYVKCPSIAAAVASVNALHGRYYAGKFVFQLVLSSLTVLLGSDGC
jgi:RNA-binding protein 39